MAATVRGRHADPIVVTTEPNGTAWTWREHAAEADVIVSFEYSHPPEYYRDEATVIGDENEDRQPRKTSASSAPRVVIPRAFTLKELARHTFQPRRALVSRGDAPIIREGDLALVHAPRGVGKTWFAHTLALVAATGADALGFTAPERAHVLIVDGEMAGEEIQNRFCDLQNQLGITSAPTNLRIVAADWQETYLPRLDTASGQAAIESYIDSAELVILDNRSCLFDPDAEKDPSAWQPGQDWLLSLRRRRKAVMVVHHSNRQGGARGHSRPEDVMNMVVKLSRPDGYTADQGCRFTCEFEKSRAAYGTAVSPFTATLGQDGWVLEGATEGDTATRKLREYLHLAHKAGDRPKSANVAITRAGVNKAAGLRAWAAMKQNGEIRQHADGGWYLG